MRASRENQLSSTKVSAIDYRHTPVLVDEVLAFLSPHPAGIYVDATLGEGGHAEAILHASAPHGRLVGIDRDAEVLAIAQQRLEKFGARAQVIHGHAGAMRSILEQLHIPAVDGILLDLGVSSYQLETAERGFSFVREGPLDMRMDRTDEPTAADLINTLDEVGLVTMIQRYGEERWARRIARAIVRARRLAPLQTTRDLAALVTQVIPPAARRPRIHPATRTFQALRIAVNQELASLHGTLSGATTCLTPGGKLCAIAYHSLEDRIVKQTFQTLERQVGDAACQVQVLTRKPVTVSAAERHANPRARSAKLRVLTCV